MKYLSKYLKSIAFLFAALILLQSCIVYERTQYPIEEAAKYNDRAIKIITLNGDTFKLNWVEERGVNLVSIMNTKRIFLDPENILQIKALDPEPFFIAVDSTINYRGDVVITIKDDKGKIKDYNFIEIEAREDLIQGLSMTVGDTSTIVIPKNTIQKIQMEDKIGSTAGNAAIGLGVVLALITTWALIQLSQDDWFSMDFSQ